MPTSPFPYESILRTFLPHGRGSLPEPPGLRWNFEPLIQALIRAINSSRRNSSMSRSSTLHSSSIFYGLGLKISLLDPDSRPQVPRTAGHFDAPRAFLSRVPRDPGTSWRPGNPLDSHISLIPAAVNRRGPHPPSVAPSYLLPPPRPAFLTRTKGYGDKIFRYGRYKGRYQRVSPKGDPRNLSSLPPPVL